jgi:hypothetical protein
LAGKAGASCRAVANPERPPSRSRRHRYGAGREAGILETSDWRECLAEWGGPVGEPCLEALPNRRARASEPLAGGLDPVLEFAYWRGQCLGRVLALGNRLMAWQARHPHLGAPRLGARPHWKENGEVPRHRSHRRGAVDLYPALRSWHY